MHVMKFKCHTITIGFSINVSPSYVFCHESALHVAMAWELIKCFNQVSILWSLETIRCFMDVIKISMCYHFMQWPVICSFNGMVLIMQHSVCQHQSLDQSIAFFSKLTVHSKIK